MRITDAMSKDVKTVPPHATLQEAAKLMKQMDVGALPIAEEGIAAGILTDRDVAVRAVADGLDPKTTPVSQVMTPSVVQLDQTTSLDEAITTMMENKIGRILVTDEEGRIAGILSVSDAAVYSLSAWEISALTTQMARRDRARTHESVRLLS